MILKDVEMRFTEDPPFTLNSRDGMLNFDGRVLTVTDMLANRLFWLSGTGTLMGLLLTVLFIGIPIVGAGLTGIVISRLIRKTNLGRHQEHFDLSSIRTVTLHEPKRWPFGRLIINVIEANGPMQHEFIFPWHRTQAAVKLKREIDGALPDSVYQDPAQTDV